MKILKVVPKEIEIIFSIPLESAERLAAAFDVAEFDLKQSDAEDKLIFDTVLEFHEMLKELIVGLNK